MRVLQRCPQYTPSLFQEAVRKPETVELLVHDDGVVVPELDKLYKRQLRHDPRDIDAARKLADFDSQIRLGVFYRDASKPRYEETRQVTKLTAEQKLELLNQELDKYAV